MNFAGAGVLHKLTSEHVIMGGSLAGAIFAAFLVAILLDTPCVQEHLRAFSVGLAFLEIPPLNLLSCFIF